MELKEVMSVVYRVLYDPNAFTDPNWDREYADKLKILFKDGPPPCCSSKMHEFAETYGVATQEKV